MKRALGAVGGVDQFDAETDIVVDPVLLDTVARAGILFKIDAFAVERDHIRRAGGPTAHEVVVAE